jgi:tight adherence protein B
MSTSRTTRSRIAAALVALGAVLLLVAPPAAAQAEAIEVRSVDATGFPLVRAVVAAPPVGGDLGDAFRVVDGGEERPASAIRLRTNDLNVVLAIDISGSMGGEPMQQAQAAVAELLATLPDSVPVSVVVFGRDAHVQHDFSTDRASIQAAVDGLIVESGGGGSATALFDGVMRSLSQLSARGGSGALVVLADGADSSSTATTEEVAERLAASPVRSSFVALESPEHDLTHMQAMATAGEGRLIAVEQSGDLVQTFGTIAASLTSVYEVRWNSVSSGDSSEVAISLAERPDLVGSMTYEHDAVSSFVPKFAEDVRVVPDAGILGSELVPVAAALGVSLGALLLLNGMRSSASAVERREQRKQSKEAAKAAKASRALGGVQDRLNDLSAQVLAKNDRGRSLDDTLDRAGLAMRSNEFVVVCAAVSAGALFLGVLLFGVPYFLLMAVPVAIGIPTFLKFKIARRRKAFVNQLGDTLQLMAGSLTAGYGLGQTLDSVARETDSPTSEEFQRVVMETRLGRSLEDALDAMSHRIQAKDFDWVVDAIKIQSSVGGNLSEIIEQVGETIRARTRIKRQVDALTAEGKISALVLFVLPFGLFGFIFSSNPDYIKPMFGSGLGQVMLGAAGLMLAAGGLWLKKLVNPEF